MNTLFIELLVSPDSSDIFVKLRGRILSNTMLATRFEELSRIIACGR